MPSKAMPDYVLKCLLLTILMSTAVSVRAQTSTPAPNAASPQKSKSLEREFFRNILRDQKAIWTAPLHLRARDPRIGLGVELAERDLLLENPARAIDLLDRQVDAVAKIAAGHGDASRYLADIHELHVGRRGPGCEQSQCG